MDNQQQNNFPYVEILEQPASKAIRFRYECEGRATGCIPGENSDPDKKTYPSIRIVGYEGRAVIIISCITKDKPYMPHPHSIVGKEMCSQGVCTIKRYTHQEPMCFSNLGIQCVKKKDIGAALKLREEIRVDPFKTGIDCNHGAIDLSVVRLCFQVFLEGQNGKFQIPLEPVVSNPIYDKKAVNELVIDKLSHCSAPTDGGMEMILLCEKVVKDNIQIVFHEIQNDQVVWRAYGEFTPGDVHKQTAISFRTPRYPITNVTNPVQVYIQLRRPSDGTTSEPVSFTLIPIDAVSEITNSLKRKRQKYNTSVVMDSQIYNQPDCKSTCQNQGESAAATTGINTTDEIYKVKLLKQLQTETESRRDVEMIDRQLNQQNIVNNNDGVDKPELILKNVAPSIFPARFTYNANNKWNNANNQASQMSSNQYQNRNTSNQFQNRDTSNQYQNRNISNQYQNQDISNQYQNRNTLNQYQNQDISNQYQNRNTLNQYQNQDISNQYQNRNTPNQCQNQNISNQYQNRNTPNQCQNQNISNQYQNRNTPNQCQNQDMSVQYQNRNTPQPVVQPNPSTVSERLPPPSSSSSSLGFSLLPIQRQNGQMNNQNQNQGPTLYRIQKPPTDHDILDNIQSPMDFNSNNLSFDVNPLDVLKELNSEDLAGLSDTFLTSVSLADPVEFEKIRNL